MSNYTLDPTDITTEAAWLTYREQLHALRDQVGVLYRAASQTLSVMQAMQDRLAPGGDLNAIAGYHTERMAGLPFNELAAECNRVRNKIRQIQAAARDGELFPRVPKD